MFAQGRGRWAVSQKPMMIRNLYFVVGDQNKKQTNKPGEDSNHCQKWPQCQQLVNSVQGLLLVCSARRWSMVSPWHWRVQEADLCPHSLLSHPVEDKGILREGETGQYFCLFTKSWLQPLVPKLSYETTRKTVYRHANLSLINYTQPTINWLSLTKG